MGSGSTNKSRKKHGEGSWALWKTAPGDITFGDLKKFVDLLHCLWRTCILSFNGSGENQLLASKLPCHCREIAVLNKLQMGIHLGVRVGMRTFSFFQGSFYDIRDLILFINCYLEGHGLHKSATFSKMYYKGTAVNWAT